MAALLYGSGLRFMECLRLRVKDLDFTYGQITVRDGKGQKDRVTMLPEPVGEPLQRHLEKVRLIHGTDLENGFGRVNLPFALALKYLNAPREWGWQYVFPASKLCRDPRTSAVTRYHLHESVLQRASKPRSGRPVSLNTKVAIRSGTVSPPTCSKMATIFERSRNCWVTKMSAQG